jgi:hypothetical protein
MLGYSTRDGAASSNPFGSFPFVLTKANVFRYERAGVVIPKSKCLELLKPLKRKS